MNLGLRLLEKRDLPQYKADMQGAFQLGAQEGGCFADGELVLPESDIDRSLGAEGAIAYKAVEGGQIVGGAIVVWDREKKLGHLDLLYVKHSTGCITEINDHLFEGRYSPMWIDGKKHSRNVYAHTREECEEKLKVLILEMKAEIAALRSGDSTEYPDGVSPKKKAIAAYLRENPGVTNKAKIARDLNMDRTTVQRYYDEIRAELRGEESPALQM